jgi:hypothetical protein
MAHPSEQKPTQAAIRPIPQHEADARLLREKTARLRELRLAHEANAHAGSPAVVSGKKNLTKKTKKRADKTQSLSHWLTTQQNEGRRG